ncbi:hypothetical protein CTAYLR_000573 [Chrysophaeum taylorii]|uniref:Uncharacterized protein n=1 Tax=Chrysophaeum taylorii TaxID=2483200 RepID=A0AAD7UGW9_9STRA|nr:hypothetical protein CTAYLR_000573 [Chrysophaeum taylorii]
MGLYTRSPSWNNTAKLWEVRSRRLVNTFEGHSGWVNSVAFSPTGELLATGSWNNTAKLLWGLVDATPDNSRAFVDGSSSDEAPPLPPPSPVVVGVAFADAEAALAAALKKELECEDAEIEPDEDFVTVFEIASPR